MSFNGIPKAGFQFLLDIRFNNNREWFNANKQVYLDNLKKPLYALTAALSDAVREVDEEIDLRPERVVSRIYRDARRIRGQAFYRDVIWFSYKRPSVESSGKSFSIYFYITPENYGWGCGFYEQNTQHMEEIRRRILLQPDTFLKIVRSPKLSKYQLNGEMYKRPKRLFEEEELTAWYNKKSFSLDYDMPIDAMAYSPELLEKLKEGMAELKDIYRFAMGMELE